MTQKLDALRILLFAYVIMYIACLMASQHIDGMHRVLMVMFFISCVSLWGAYEVCIPAKDRRRAKHDNVLSWLVAYFVIGSGGVLVLVS